MTLPIVEHRLGEVDTPATRDMSSFSLNSLPGQAGTVLRAWERGVETVRALTASLAGQAAAPLAGSGSMLLAIRAVTRARSLTSPVALALSTPRFRRGRGKLPRHAETTRNGGDANREPIPLLGKPSWKTERRRANARRLSTARFDSTRSIAHGHNTIRTGAVDIKAHWRNL